MITRRRRSLLLAAAWCAACVTTLHPSSVVVRAEESLDAGGSNSNGAPSSGDSSTDEGSSSSSPDPSPSGAARRPRGPAPIHHRSYWDDVAEAEGGGEEPAREAGWTGESPEDEVTLNKHRELANAMRRLTRLLSRRDDWKKVKDGALRDEMIKKLDAEIKAVDGEIDEISADLHVHVQRRRIEVLDDLSAEDRAILEGLEDGLKGAKSEGERQGRAVEGQEEEDAARRSQEELGKAMKRLSNLLDQRGDWGRVTDERLREEMLKKIEGDIEAANREIDEISKEMSRLHHAEFVKMKRDEKRRADEDKNRRRREELEDKAEEILMKRLEEEKRKKEGGGAAQRNRGIDHGQSRIIPEGHVLQDSEQTQKRRGDAAGGRQRGGPSSQPTSNAVQFEHTYEHVYDSIFRPNAEEYDVFKFDPYSLSGAPLGGWGRATRSRLATLPIRLVSDLDGGMDLTYGGGIASLWGGGGRADSEKADEREGGGGEKKESEGVGSASKAVGGAERKRSTGPHFSVRDDTGQRYVCRVYPEDELAVISRIDSAFHPAITVWDEEEAAEKKGGDAASGSDEGAEEIVAEVKEEGGGGSDGKKKKFHFTIAGNDGKGVDGMTPSQRRSVSKILEKMGMPDAAAALEAGEAGAGEVTIAAAGGDLVQNIANALAANDPNGNEMIRFNVDARQAAGRDIADIIKAAAMGASAGRAGGGDRGGEGAPADEGGAAEEGSGPVTTAPQMTPEEVHRVLRTLRGTCSQFHDGWWSYEWCHEEKARQFHVEVSRDPAPTPRYDIQDVTLVGKYTGRTTIIHPRGVYGGREMEGQSSGVKWDDDGTVRQSVVTKHTPRDDAKWSKSIWAEPPPQAAASKSKDWVEPKVTSAGHRGPIIQQMYEHGAMCMEAGTRRRMVVELHCCYEDEVEQWLDLRGPVDKRREAASPLGGGGGGKSKKDLPQAVLVSVEENETCVYRSRVCTPMLCPREDGRPGYAGAASASKADAASGSLLSGRQPSDNSVDSLLHAIFGDDMLARAGEVQVYFPDDFTGQEFDELVRLAEGGGNFADHPSFQRVREALRNGKRTNKKKVNIRDIMDEVTKGSGAEAGGGKTPAGVMEVKPGESIRQILDKTLGARPCLVKNLGW